MPFAETSATTPYLRASKLRAALAPCDLLLQISEFDTKRYLTPLFQNLAHTFAISLIRVTTACHSAVVSLCSSRSTGDRDNIKWVEGSGAPAACVIYQHRVRDIGCLEALSKFTHARLGRNPQVPHICTAASVSRQRSWQLERTTHLVPKNSSWTRDLLFALGHTSFSEKETRVTPANINKLKIYNPNELAPHDAVSVSKNKPGAACSTRTPHLPFIYTKRCQKRF